jgi:hypothetical protein
LAAGTFFALPPCMKRIALHPVPPSGPFCMPYSAVLATAPSPCVLVVLSYAVGVWSCSSWQRYTVRLMTAGRIVPRMSSVAVPGMAVGSVVSSTHYAWANGNFCVGFRLSRHSKRRVALAWCVRVVVWFGLVCWPVVAACFAAEELRRRGPCQVGCRGPGRLIPCVLPACPSTASGGCCLNPLNPRVGCLTCSTRWHTELPLWQ